MTKPTLQDHLNPNSGHKRILSLSGGGVRGLVTLGVLTRVEEILREKTGDPDAVLSDHFDLIAGTSTGSIIACGLALGWSVERIKKLYDELCPILFKPNRIKGILKFKFDAEKLERKLDENLMSVDGKPIKLGSKELKTGLLICAKRMDTDSAWVLTNHPDSKFYDAGPGQTWLPNKLYTLKSLIRASTAAPSFLEPVKIKISDGKEGFKEEWGVFVDGAISGHNCPALAAFKVATLPSYAFNWNTGEKDMSVLSIGTGQFRNRQKWEDFLDRTPAQQGIEALKGMINESQKNTIMVMQAISHSHNAWWLNSEINGLEGELVGEEPLVNFRHIDVNIENDDIRKYLHLETATGKEIDKIVDRMRDMANGRQQNLLNCYRLGRSLSTEVTEQDLFF